ncbi:hypothetical protein ACF5W4_10490 [Bacillota bacterium Lsc_1132]
MRSFIEMTIDRYYRAVAKISLNGSIAALFPAIVIILGNFFVFNQAKIMLLTVPFIFYSFIQFHFYLRHINQSLSIQQQLLKSQIGNYSLFGTRHLLVFYLNTQFPQLLFYFPDGSLAGTMQASSGKQRSFLRLTKEYTLLNKDSQIVGFYKVKGKRTIEVYDETNCYLGLFEVMKRGTFLKKAQKEVVDSTGRFVGAVEGSRIFMDEHLLDQKNKSIGRLRRGWMPLEWHGLFPDPNTPVFSFSGNLTKNEKLLRFSLFINEYFIER